MAALYTRILSYFYKFKFIHTAHNTFYNKRKLTNFALKKSSIVAVGDNVRKNLINEFDIKNDNITVIYNSIEVENIKYKVVDEINNYKKQGFFTVGNIGRISKQKGMEYFVQAATEVVKLNNKIRFFIVGDGEDRNKIEKLISDCGMNEYIIMMGFRSDITDIINQLDLIVLSSLWEGLPLTPIEAFSLGKTVIGTNVDGTPEIIQDGYNGILIEPKNYVQIAQNIIYLQENNKELELLKYNAKNTYKNKFSYDVFRQKYTDFYKKIAMEVR